MHGKKEDTLPFVASYLINEPSPLPSLPPGELDEGGQSLDERLFEDSEEDSPTQTRLSSRVDQGDALEQHVPVRRNRLIVRVYQVDQDDALGQHVPGTVDSALVKKEDTPSQFEQDSWGEQEDPFEQRHLPTTFEAAPIEEEDIQRAIAQVETHIISNVPATPAPSPHPLVSRFRLSQSRRGHFTLVALVIALILLLILDGTLFLLNINRPHSSPLTSRTPTQPMLTVTPTATHPGQIVILHISKFSPSVQVALTRDMQLPVRIDSGTSLIKIGRDGQADVHVLVEDSWGAGAHLLMVEDTHSHYISSVTLQVTSDFPAPLPLLVVSNPDESNWLSGPLSFGTGIPEENSIQSLLLRNVGGSWISWKATSDSSWLSLAPQQGVFQDSQGIFVAAKRIHLAPGYHQGTITVTSNAGKPIIIQAEVTVLPSPKTASALLAIEPPLLSFIATDGASDPASQYLTVSNLGVQPLNWSITTNIPQDPLTQDTSSSLDSSAWLHTDIPSGSLAPGASARIRIVVQSQQLLPGIYGAVMLFTVNGNPLDTLQPVAVVLTVQPRCGVTSSPGSVSLAVVSGRQSSFDQPLDISTTPGCADVTNWQSFPQTNWLNMVPGSGQLQPGIITRDHLVLDVSTLPPGTYNAWVDLLTEMRSQTLMVQLTVLSPSGTIPTKTTGGIAPSTPVSGITPTGTPVSTTSSPVPSSTVTQGTPTAVPGTPTPVPGTPTPTPGTPVPQSCTLQVTPVHLTFIATLLQSNPPAQTLALSVTGSCPQPVSWTASADAASQGWLHLAATSGTASKSGSTLVVQVNTNGKLLGTYTGQIKLVAIDHSGVPTQGSPQVVSVTLTVVL